MRLCPNCFEETSHDICQNCHKTIVIEERYTLVHCVKVIPRMCFEGTDLQNNSTVFLYQKHDLSWCVVASPNDLDIKKVHQEIQGLETIFEDTKKHRKQRIKKNQSLYLIEEPLDPLEPNGESQFVIQLPQKRGWWNQQQSQHSWKHSTIHPALILVCCIILFGVTSLTILFLLP